MILTNGSVMFICVKLPVLCNAPLCALPTILQVNKPLQVAESWVWSLAVYFLFYIFTILLVPCCSTVCMFIQWWKFRHFYILCVHCATFIYSYIHTSCDVLWSTISQKQSIVSCVLTTCVIAFFFFFFVKVCHIVCFWWSTPLYEFLLFWQGRKA